MTAAKWAMREVNMEVDTYLPDTLSISDAAVYSVRLEESKNKFKASHILFHDLRNTLEDVEVVNAEKKAKVKLFSYDLTK